MRSSRRTGWGQANVEYILILVCLVLVSIASLNLYGAQVATAYWQVVTAFGVLADDLNCAACLPANAN
jgi:Flp pilus assembly pilin Flp